VKESRLALWNNAVFVLTDLRSCGDSSTKCNFCSHVVISYGVHKSADSTEGPLHLEPLKTKQNKTLLLVFVGDMQRAGIVITPPKHVSQMLSSLPEALPHKFGNSVPVRKGDAFTSIKHSEVIRSSYSFLLSERDST
jgi:hypothetical protein